MKPGVRPRHAEGGPIRSALVKSLVNCCRRPYPACSAAPSPTATGTTLMARRPLGQWSPSALSWSAAPWRREAPQQPAAPGRTPGRRTAPVTPRAPVRRVPLVTRTAPGQRTAPARPRVPVGRRAPGLRKAMMARPGVRPPAGGAGRLPCPQATPQRTMAAASGAPTCRTISRPVRRRPRRSERAQRLVAFVVGASG